MTMHYYGIFKRSWTQGGPGDPFFTTAVNTHELKEAHLFEVNHSVVDNAPVDREVDGSIPAKDSR